MRMESHETRHLENKTQTPKEPKPAR